MLEGLPVSGHNEHPEYSTVHLIVTEEFNGQTSCLFQLLKQHAAANITPDSYFDTAELDNRQDRLQEEFIVYTASLADSSLCGRAAGSFLNTCLMEDIPVTSAEIMSELVVRK